MNRITNSAAMLVRESGSSVSQKKRNGPGAVDARGFDQFVRHRHEELPEQQRRGRGRDQRQREARIGVEQVEVGGDLVGRIDAHLDRAASA